MRNKLLAAVVLLAGCSLFGGGVAQRAADYYSFRLGHEGNKTYSSFLSPAYRKTFDKDALTQLNHAMHRGSIKGGNIEKLPASDIEFVVEGNFALTRAAQGLESVYATLGEQTWVKAGSQWSLYNWSEAEVDAYGMPATSLALPEASEAEIPAPPLTTGNDEPGAEETGEEEGSGEAGSTGDSTQEGSEAGGVESGG